MKAKDFNLSKEELVEMAEKYMNETFKRYDFIADSTSGVYVYDENGDAYLDFLGGIAVNSVGFMYLIISIVCHRLYLQSLSVNQLVWIRFSSKIPEQKQTKQ